VNQRIGQYGAAISPEIWSSVITGVTELGTTIAQSAATGAVAKQQRAASEAALKAQRAQAAAATKQAQAAAQALAATNAQINGVSYSPPVQQAADTTTPILIVALAGAAALAIVMWPKTAKRSAR
jgi:hypothetical protein